MGKLSRGVRSAAAAMAKSLAVVGAASATAFALMVRRASEFESAFTGVRKTVDETAEGFARLRSGLLDLSKRIPQSAVELAGIMEVAGQLGVKGVDNLLSFTETIARLADATDIAGESGAASLARFMEVLGIPPAQVDRLGSTLVELGNNFAATEGEILALAQRIAGAGRVAGLTAPEILGISAALRAVGVEADAGGTAVSKLIIMLASARGEELSDLAQVAGLTSDAFARIVKESPAEALEQFLSGLGGIQKAGGDVFGTLEKLGITEIRLRDATLRTALASETLGRAIKSANSGFKENTALTVETEKRYSTLESTWKLTKNAIVALAIETGKPFLEPMAGFLRDNVMPLLAKFGAWVIEHKDEIIAFAESAIGLVGEKFDLLANGIKANGPAIIGFFKKMWEWVGFVNEGMKFLFQLILDGPRKLKEFIWPDLKDGPRGRVVRPGAEPPSREDDPFLRPGGPSLGEINPLKRFGMTNSISAAVASALGGRFNLSPHLGAGVTGGGGKTGGGVTINSPLNMNVTLQKPPDEHELARLTGRAIRTAVTMGRVF
jgi:TP901 family phage tail tape measure protein